MTEQQIATVRDTWMLIQPQVPKFIDLLYEELFTAEPQLRILFEGPMEEQHHKVAEVFSHAVAHLDHPQVLRTELKALGHRHEGYGVQPHHFIALGDALQGSLRRLLMKQYTPEVRDAWQALYEHLSQGMQGKHAMAGA